MFDKGTPSKIGASFSRKKSDGDYGSYEYSFWIEEATAPDVDYDAWFEKAEEYLTMRVGNALAKHDVIVEKTETSTKTQPAPEVEEAEANEPMEVVKFSFEKVKGGKFMLGLFENFGDKPGKWASIKYTADQEHMWNMIETVLGEYDFTDLPIEEDCKIFADWKWGKEKPKGEGRYKDLVRIRER